MIAPTSRRDLDLDFASLTRGVGLRTRLRAVAANNVMVIGATIAVLLLVVPLVALVAMVDTSNAGDPVAVTLLVVGSALGGYAVLDVLGQAGGPGGLARFAEVNGLTSLSGTIRRDYAGSLFADGTHLVHQAVRTQDDAFVEVGDRFPTTPPPTTDEENLPELYLRGRLAGRTARGADLRVLVTPELHEQLTRFAGPYVVEVSRREVTVFGSRRLDVAEPGRVEEAFALVDALVARADALLVAPGSRGGAAEPEQTLSGIPIPDLTPPAEPGSGRGRPASALRTVGLTLTLLIVAPLAYAVVLSNLDSDLAVVAVPLLIAATFAVVGLLVRASTTRRADGRAVSPEAGAR